ncbi:MAG TPA: alpha/beta fold hydrolase [Telluria sp.]|nr:alpha/beta fold hydrolase [Telluria sp.]
MKALMFSLLLLAAGVQAAPTETPVTLDTGSGVLHGTLAMPAAANAPVPAVLLVAGSGPTDRDGNTAALPGHNDSLKLLANALAGAGFATVRYDKRGIAASRIAMASEADLRFDHYVDDAARWLRQMKADPRFSGVAVLGHSEGSLIAMLAARKVPVAAVVSVAGPARGAAQILRAQLQDKLPPPLLADSERVIAALERGETVNDAPPALAALFRPSVQPYLMSWFRYVPAQEVARLSMPVLIIQGSTDLQVPTLEADALGRANPRAQVAVVPGMNHVLKEAAGGLAEQMPTYSDPSLPLAPGFVERLTAFLKVSLK